MMRISFKRFHSLSLFTLLCILCISHISPAFADLITWTDWTSATSGSSATATGNIGSIGITYTGDIAFYQLGSPATNYWSEGTPAAYTGNSLVDNAPTANELIATDNRGLRTINFSEVVQDPIMAILSLGRPSLPVTYDFDTPFTLIGEGRGYWGDGNYTKTGNLLTGYELHGVIQFSGSVQSISWLSSTDEYWHGITIGLPDQTSPAPEPSTMLLLGVGLIGLAGATRRKPKK